MMTKTKAIVLRTIKYGDASVVADLFTEELGRLSFMVRIPKSQKARVKKQFFQPLSVIEVDFDFRPRSGLQYLRDVRLSLPFASIPFDAVKLSLSLFLAEFIYYSTRDEQRNAGLFQYVENSISWLDAADHAFANFHLVFMMRFSRFIGFYPNLDDYVEGCFFDLRSASFCSKAPLHRDFLLPEEAERINTLMRMNYESMHLFRMNRLERNRITEIILNYYRQHVPNMPELQSFSVMRELFV